MPLPSLVPRSYSRSRGVVKRPNVICDPTFSELSIGRKCQIHCISVNITSHKVLPSASRRGWSGHRMQITTDRQNKKETQPLHRAVQACGEKLTLELPMKVFVNLKDLDVRLP